MDTKASNQALQEEKQLWMTVINQKQVCDNLVTRMSRKIFLL